MAELEGEIALVTGASRGIGAAILRELAGRGAFVVGTATRAEGAQAITESLGELGYAGCGEVLDVADSGSVTTLTERLSAGRGAPSILINNAGITRDGLLVRMSEADWDAVINTNLTAGFRTVRACLRAMMRARRGRIVNISSIVGSSGNAGQANYAAAKAGLIGFTRSLAREVASRGITVNAVAPGFIATDMTAALSEAQRDALLAAVPLARLGTVQEVASTVAFLVSPAAGYITGHTMHVNGGMYMG